VPDPRVLLRRPLDLVTGLALKGADAVSGAAVLARAGAFRPIRPDVVPRALLALAQEGVTPAAAYRYAALRYPGALGLVDEAGSLTFSETAARIGGYAAALETAGVKGGDAVGVLCRNHSGLVIAIAALSSIGADVVLMNTSSSGGELAAVIEAQLLVAVVHDEELEEALGEVPPEVVRIPVWRPGFAGGSARRHGAVRGPGSSRSRYVLLTSGTTGTPKGSARRPPATIEPLLAILSRIPYRVRDTTFIASPVFHAWGFGNLGLGIVLSSTLVLRERFDPEEALAAIARHRVRVLTAVPVMLQRLVELPEEVRRRYDLSSLEVVASSGSAMPGELATEFMDRFGDVLYNLYGSTEAAWASIATPDELRLAPRTAGRAPLGTKLRIVDEAGADVEPGETGRILVGNSMISPDEGESDVPAGFVATGDLGHFGEDGLLFVDGRADDMIVSGGENVYPGEVEDHLSAHPAVREAVVVGVDDEKFGQRLRAAVVLHDGRKAGEDELKQYLRSKVARFKVPREIVFLDELPRNAAGKALRRKVREDG
jgi:acyl-CoA synthetase (AMP-forming)/AMP-acid ligase II